MKVHPSAVKHGVSEDDVVTMRNEIAKPVDGSYGEIDGVETTEEVTARLVKNAEEGSRARRSGLLPGGPGPMSRRVQ